MTNQFRSKAFIKIKHSIRSAYNASHLISCRQMLENAVVVCSKDELTILKEYLLSAWDRINPVGEDNPESIWHKQQCKGRLFE